MSILHTIKKTITRENGKKEESVIKKSSVASAISARMPANFLIVRPHVTEKSSLTQANNNIYTFKVSGRATANEIKKEIQRMFSVTVVRVNMANMPSKKIRFGGREGKVPGFRKAMVLLKEGEKIDAGV